LPRGSSSPAERVRPDRPGRRRRFPAAAATIRGPVPPGRRNRERVGPADGRRMRSARRMLELRYVPVLSALNSPIRVDPHGPRSRLGEGKFGRMSIGMTVLPLG
jgi:hypothetical protein